jgi:hypothetical protein
MSLFNNLLASNLSIITMVIIYLSSKPRSSLGLKTWKLCNKGLNSFNNNTQVMSI